MIWKKKYRETGEENEGKSESKSITDFDWMQSGCCEWKTQGVSCNQFEMRVSSWIELDDKSDAYTHVEFFDDANHDVCSFEEWEHPADITQEENKDS
jgi:hypothetical protein